MAKLKIMVVRSAYDVYIKELETRFKGFETFSFQEQVDCIVKDGYGAAHTPTSCLVNCEKLLVYSNCYDMQNTWLREQGLPEQKGEDWQHSIVKTQIEFFKPDILYLTDCITYEGDFLSTLEFTPPCILGWRGAFVPLGINWKGFDGILSGFPKLLALSKSLGAADGFMFHPSMPLWIAKALAAQPQEVDVVFIGSVSPMQHVNRVALISTLANAAKKFGFSLEMYLNCSVQKIDSHLPTYIHEPIFGFPMYKALRRARIVIDDRASHYAISDTGENLFDIGQEETVNIRLFEGCCSGSMVLTEHLSGLSKFFEPNKEVATYTNHAHAIERILYYLTHDEERLQIARAGQRRCAKEWNTGKAAGKFLAIAKDILSKKGKNVEDWPKSIII